MGFVDHDERFILLGQGHDLGQLGHVAFHREDAIRHDQADRSVRELLELGFQVGHVGVFVAGFLHALGDKTAAVNDGGVVQFVGNDNALGAAGDRDGALVGAPAGNVSQAGFRLQEGSDLLLKLSVDVKSAADETDGSGAGAVLVDTRLAGFLDLGKIGEAEVVVGGHDHGAAVAFHLSIGVHGRLQIPEFLVSSGVAQRLHLVGQLLVVFGDC